MALCNATTNNINKHTIKLHLVFLISSNNNMHSSSAKLFSDAHFNLSFTLLAFHTSALTTGNFTHQYNTVTTSRHHLKMHYL